MDGNTRGMSIMIRPDSGTKTRQANHNDVNIHINQLQQELTRSRAEAQRSKDKLSCLISLVRRSWNGDRNASIHLANIVGLDLPPTLLDTGTTGRPGTRMQTPSMANTHQRATMNWERMALRLLQHDYEQTQSEIREYQQRYIENRSRFMDEVMHHHHQDMARTPISRPTSAKLSTIDQQFLQTHSKVSSEGRFAGKKLPQRCKSAVTRAQGKAQRDVVEQAEVRLRDLFVESSAPAGGMSSADASLGSTKEKQAPRTKHTQQDYDDARRYSQNNLFNVEEIRARKPRPMSAAVLRERDQQRARPRSAVTVNTIGPDFGTTDRPLKYETTKPVAGQRAATTTGRKTAHSNSVPHTSPTSSSSNIINSSDPPQENYAPFNRKQSFSEEVPSFKEELEDEVVMTQEPPISVRVKNAIARPEFVDKFSDDLRHMEQMEKQFKMNTMALQKKLGLPDNGMV